MKNHPFLFLISFGVSFWIAILVIPTRGERIDNYEISDPITEMSTSKPTPVVIPTPLATQAGGQATPEPEDDTSTPQAEPDPAPQETPDVWSPPDLEPIFARYAGQYGVDKNVLERLANCESHFDPDARNGNYLGLFQFSERTWMVNREQIGADPNPDLRVNAEESVKTAAYLITQQGTSPWPACLR